MRYDYNVLTLELEDEEVYWMWDLISFALDLDAKENCLTDEKRRFARKLLEITREDR